MSKTANTNNTDSIKGLDVVLDDWIENRYPTAKKRSCGGNIDAIWQHRYPALMGPHLVGKAAVATNNYAFSGGTEIVITGHAFVASHT